MTTDSTSAFYAILTAAENFEDNPTLVNAVRIHCANLSREELIALVAGFAGLSAGVAETRRAERLKKGA
jgi:hypothetical protein